MKTILRIFIILAVALAIVGVTLAAMNANSTGTVQAFEAGAGRSLPGASGLVPGQAPEGFERGGFRAGLNEMNSGLFSLGETIKNVVIVTVFVLVVVLVERLLKARRTNKTTPVPVSNEQPDRKE